MKRFTETTKWADPWFRGLSSKHKALWQYLLDTCDHAGLLKANMDWGLVSFQVGEPCTADDLKAFDGRLELVGDLIWIRKFCVFQYGRFDSDTTSRVQSSVIQALDRAGISLDKAMDSLSIAYGKPIDSLSIGYAMGINTPKDKDKDKEKDNKGVQGELIEKDELSFPAAINTDAFRAAWGRYIDYRRKAKLKKLQPISAQAQLEKLANWGEQAAIQSINETIANAWAGLFAPKNQPQVAQGAAKQPSASKPARYIPSTVEEIDAR